MLSLGVHLSVFLFGVHQIAIYYGFCIHVEEVFNSRSTLSLNDDRHILLLTLDKHLLVGCGSWPEDSENCSEGGRVNVGQSV